MDVANHLHVGRRDTGQYSFVEVSKACQQHTVRLWWGRGRGEEMMAEGEFGEERRTDDKVGERRRQ